MRVGPGRCGSPARRGDAVGQNRVRAVAGGAEGPAADRHLDRRPENFRLQRRCAGRALRSLDRRPRSSDADGGVHRHPEAALASLQPLQRRPDAVHAAHHLVGGGAALRSPAGPSGFARLHPPHRGIRRPPVAAHQARQPGDHRPRGRGAGRDFPPAVVRAARSRGGLACRAGRGAQDRANDRTSRRRLHPAGQRARHDDPSERARRAGRAGRGGHGGAPARP